MEQLTLDLLRVIYAYGVFILAFTANILFSLYFNIAMKHQKFDRQRLWTSLKKACVFIIATEMMVVAIGIAGVYFTLFIPELSEQLQTSLSIMMVIATIGRASLNYLIEAYQTFSNVLNYKEKADSTTATKGR